MVVALACVRTVSKVLLVDDHETQLDIWELQLAKLRVCTLRATSYDHALELARTEHPEVALVDMVLDEWANEPRSGLELIRDLHQIYPDMYKHLCSSWVGLGKTCIAMRWGCNDVTYKTRDANLIVKAACGIRLDPEIDRLATLEEVECEHIERALLDYNGNITQAADALGIDPRSLRRKIDRLKPRIFVPVDNRKGTRRSRAR